LADAALWFAVQVERDLADWGGDHFAQSAVTPPAFAAVLLQTLDMFDGKKIQENSHGAGAQDGIAGTTQVHGAQLELQHGTQNARNRGIRENWSVTIFVLQINAFEDLRSRERCQPIARDFRTIHQTENARHSGGLDAPQKGVQLPIRELALAREINALP